MPLQIRCINKIDRPNRFERITHVGWEGWKMTQKEAIDAIKLFRQTFFVNVWGNRVDVIVSKSRFGNDYLKTTSDGEDPDNLLSLPECVWG